MFLNYLLVRINADFNLFVRKGINNPISNVGLNSNQGLLQYSTPTQTKQVSLLQIKSKEAIEQQLKT